MIMRQRLSAAVVAALACAGAQAWAGDNQPQGVVALSASASAEVTKDLLSVTFSTSREGADAAAVQGLLKQALDAALAEAKKVAKPGQIDVQTGNFSLFPRYAAKGGITGWQGTAELVVEGRDIPGIGQLAGRITTMSIARVGSNLSREARAKVESDVAAQAIARYRAKAAEYAKLFGYNNYTIREVTVGANEPIGYAMAPAAAKMDRSLYASSESLPVELGKGTVTMTVNGTVQMSK